MEVTIIGGGLAGCEAAWQIAKRGINVNLFEMRPLKSTGAHTTGLLAELVCSNSLGSNNSIRALGILKNELRLMDSLLIQIADRFAIPAGDALAVDRLGFAEAVTDKITHNHNITIVRKEVVSIPIGVTVIASGPLTSHNLMSSIMHITGEENLYFYDAMAPIVFKSSIDMEKIFFSTRDLNDEMGKGDYINCPLSKEEYIRFVEALILAEQSKLNEVDLNRAVGIQMDDKKFFEACLPIEIMAR